jgi:hypothetical protein
MAILLEDHLPAVKYGGLNTAQDVVFSGSAVTLPAGTTIGGSSVSALGVITSASATALAVGLAGATNSAFVVDSSTASQAAGLKIVGAVAAGTVAAVVISSGADASLTINAKGTGTIGIGSVSTGAVTITPATTIVGALNITAAAGVLSTVSGARGAFMQTGSGNVAAVAAAAAIPLTNYYSKLDSNAGATTQTLAASTVIGLQKKIHMTVDGGDDVVTVTSLSGGTVITFADVGDVAELIWTGTAWMPLALYNIADGVTGPVIS